MIRIFQGYNEPTISNLGVYQQDMVVSSKLRTLALSQGYESVHGGMPIPPLWEHNKNVCQMFVYGSHLLWVSIRELLVTQRIKFCQQPIGSSRYIDGLWHTQTGHRRLCHSEGYPWHTQATCSESLLIRENPFIWMSTLWSFHALLWKITIVGWHRERSQRNLGS